MPLFNHRLTVEDSICPGCNKRFTTSGLSKHLTQTKKPQCVAIRKLLDANILTPPGAAPPPPVPATQPSSDSSTEPPFPLSDIDMDAEPVVFAGDFFGDYIPEDFDNGVPGPEGSTCESSDDEPRLDHWEPEPELVYPLPSSTAVAPTPAVPTRTARSAAEESARVRKTVVDPFPRRKGRAGAVMKGHTTAQKATYEDYDAEMEQALRDNAYAPFTSRIDWEVARWAKLRGSGSTAFTDLLAIEGVSINEIFMRCATV